MNQPARLLPRLAAEVMAKPRSMVDFRAWADPATGELRHKPYVILGTLSGWSRRERHKYVDRSVWPVGAAELARPYLRHIHMSQSPETGMAARRVPFRREAIEYLKLSPPAFFLGPWSGPAAYVDIVSAYFSIYAPAALDLDYIPGRRFGVGRVRFLNSEELAPAKATRNAVAGIIRSTTMLVARYGTTGAQRSHNTYLAPDLWAVVMHTLAAIAADAVTHFGAVYWATDGGIFPADRADAFRDYLARCWDLTGTVRAAGDGEVRSWGSWSVGNVSTLIRGAAAPRARADIAQLDPGERRHLLAAREFVLTGKGGRMPLTRTM